MAINQLQHAHGLLVYPSDVYTLSYQFNSTTQSSNLYVGTGGNIRVLTAGGDDITFYNVQSGSFLPVHASKVFLTGTTASNILAMDMNLTGGGMNQETFAYLSATGITGDTEVSAINTLVSSLKLNGLWSKMKAVYPFVTDNRNLLGYTEDFGNAVWSKGDTTTTNNATTAPNGTTTADKIEENTNTSFHFVSFATGLMSLTNNYTLTCYAKASQRTWCSVYLYDGSTSYQTFFDLANGAIGTIGSGMTASIESAGNGWYRCRVSRNITGSGSANGGILTATGNNQSNYAGTNGSGIFVWGAQLELGSTATTYQPIATTQQSYISNQFKYNLVNPIDSDAAFRLVFNGGWTMSNQGATPNGTNAWGDTKLPNNTMSQNSMTMCTYLRTDTLLTTGDLGVWSGGFGSIIYSRDGLGFFTGINNSTTTNRVSVLNSNSLGFFLNKRTSATEIVLQKNATQTTLASNSQNLLTSNFIIGRTGDYTAGEYSNRQTAFVGIGDGISNSEATALYNAVQTFNSSLNRAVAP